MTSYRSAIIKTKSGFSLSKTLANSIIPIPTDLDVVIKVSASKIIYIFSSTINPSFCKDVSTFPYRSRTADAAQTIFN